MAYNPNMYMPYQPNYMPSPAAFNMPAQQPVNGIIAVAGLEGAKAYPLPPNSRIMLFDNDEDIMYSVTTDSGGFKTINQFTFQPKDPEPEHSADSVSRQEFDDLCDRLNKLVVALNGKEAEDAE